jgi:hypothetical protein
MSDIEGKLQIVAPKSKYSIGDKVKIARYDVDLGTFEELLGQDAIIEKMHYMPYDQWHYWTSISSWYIPEEYLDKVNDGT